MSLYILIVIGVLAGFAAGLAVSFIRSGKISGLKAECSNLKSNLDALQLSKKESEDQLRKDYTAQLESLQKSKKESEEQLRKDYNARIESLQAAKKESEEQLRKDYNAQIESLKQERKESESSIKSEYEQNLERERKNAKQLKEESDKQWEVKFEKLQESLQKLTAEQLGKKQEQLDESNRKQMEDLMKPLREKFEEFKKSVEESKKENAASKTSIEEKFKSTMELFQQSQDQAIKTLKEETAKIGSDANNLSKALKGDSKLQGDWGEMLLSSILENSGLRKGEEYFVQENIKDEEGKNYRPDVIVKLPEGKDIIIDSKVSLTAYSEAVAQEDEKKKESLINEHVKSVVKHIDELAAKDYIKKVNESSTGNYNPIGYVLMFVPNESSYICALKRDSTLGQYAYKKGVILVSPSNMMMALQLANNMWHIEKQNKNVQKIVDKAYSLYTKVSNFQDSFEKVSEKIESLGKTFEEARKQLYSGRGSVIKQVKGLTELGVNVSKDKQLTIPEAFDEE